MDAGLVFIGHIETPYTTPEECPRNIDPVAGPVCRVVLDPPYDEALLTLKPGQKILLLYWMHQADRDTRVHKRRRSGELRGVFSLRSQHRPNPIGAALLPAESIEGNVVTVRGMDCVNGTPVLDIKPAIKDEL